MLQRDAPRRVIYVSDFHLLNLECQFPSIVHAEKCRFLAHTPFLVNFFSFRACPHADRTLFNLHRFLFHSLMFVSPQNL